MIPYDLKCNWLNLLITAAFFTGLGTQPVLAQADGIGPGEAVFGVLASEIALQRGEAGLAYSTYIELARELKDPRLAQRAVEIAITAGSPKLAMQAAQTWDSLVPPSDLQPKQVLVTLLMLNQRWPESVKPAIALLSKQTPAEREFTLQQIQSLIAKANNETEALIAFYGIVSALNPLPKDPSILYTYAMSAEKAGHVEVMEKTLRTILRVNPNDANTLNALGYSYAERNQNLPEAFKLLSKAHQLSPNDAFILDSLGWVNYRLGKNALALEQLEQAYQVKPEADIAGHLGEVLWVMNRPQEAEQIWRQGQKLDANNPTLQATLKHYKPAWEPSTQNAKGAWDGRFAVTITGVTESKNNGGSGGFTLTQDALTDVLEIRNPIGGSLAKITIKPGQAELERNGEITRAVDADTLIQNSLGLPLPARGLADWLHGQARPGSNASIDRDESGQVSKIIQDGWTLNYIWNSTHRLEKLTMTRSSTIGSIDIRLVFDTPND
jgi:outer membrane biogenesis lipoprotein LolB/uncharacterized protein HemY